MSFWKAEQLLSLATLSASRLSGVTLDDVVERFSVSKRTAQRMLRALENQFPDTNVRVDPDGRKRWRLEAAAMRDLISVTPEELVALDVAIALLTRSGSPVEAEDLKKLLEKILALVPRGKAVRLETDHYALLEAMGLAARPGPRTIVDRNIAAAIAEAIKACRVLDISYQARDEQEPRPRRIMPLGVLAGFRRYVVGRPVEEPTGPLRHYLVENIHMASVSNETFTRDSEFDLKEHAGRAFGVFQNDEEYGEVVWRFAPAAAERARGFEFHPDQRFEQQPDGSLIVSFQAAGHLEMCWHLYAWGDQVEVLAPDALRTLVEGYRRGDFPSLP